MNQVYHGRCLCGAIRYEAKNLSPLMAHCHCSMCRKFHGAAFATFGEVAVEDFKWLQGESELQTYQAVNGTLRPFCRHCGSRLTFSPSSARLAFVEFALGTLDTPLDLRPDAHIFGGSKANWSCIADGLPQFEAGRGSASLTQSLSDI